MEHLRREQVLTPMQDPGKIPIMSARRRIQIAHVTWQLNMGGMEKLLVEFARHTDRRRFQLHFVSLGQRGSLAGDIERHGWPVTALEEPPGLRPGLVWRLARCFRRWRIDVVHTHNTGPLLYAGLAARLARVAGLVHTRHGQRYGASLRETAGFRLVARLVNQVVCVSRDSARLSVHEGIASNKVCTIWNGIDAARFGYVGPQPDGPVVMVGRLSPEKDVATLIEAIALAAPRWPSLRLEIAGEGPCLPALRQKAQQLGVAERVSFLGEVRDIAGLLGRASLFVLPSLTEGVSLTLLEAMARGLPVVATRVGGNPEVVVSGVTGLLVAPGAPAELAEAMLQVLLDPEEGQRLGREGRRRVESCFEVRRMVAEYEALYHAFRTAPRNQTQTIDPLASERKVGCGAPPEQEVA